MSGGVVLSASVLLHEKYTVATAPSASDHEGGQIYVSDGAAGSPILAFSDGTDWLRVDDGTTAIAIA